MARMKAGVKPSKKGEEGDSLGHTQYRGLGIEFDHSNCDAANAEFRRDADHDPHLGRKTVMRLIAECWSNAIKRRVHMNLVTSPSNLYLVCSECHAKGPLYAKRIRGRLERIPESKSYLRWSIQRFDISNLSEENHRGISLFAARVFCPRCAKKKRNGDRRRMVETERKRVDALMRAR